MKSVYISIILLTVTTLLLVGFSIPYNKAKPPKLNLPDAYGYAVIAIGSATNEFHCISANIATSFSPDGEWLFTFYSTNSAPKWVTVEFQGKVHVEDVMAR